jgi:hypothetical protein
MIPYNEDPWKLDNSNDPWMYTTGVNGYYFKGEWCGNEWSNQICASCGESHNAQEFDFMGRCEVTVEKLHSKIRKLFWNKYSHNKKIN